MSDGVAPPRLLLRLEAEIAGAQSQLDADCKRAERAAYLARMGKIDEVQAEVAELQLRYEASPNARVSSWLHLVLALVAHVKDMGSAARERLLRAHAISAAAGLNQLQALSAAWVAHMDYLQANVHSMVRRASESLRLARDDDHSTRSRASLVVAQAYHLAGRLDAALPWYARARSHATAEGDAATLSALMHGMAWLRAQELRVRGWMRTEVAGDEGHALLAAESAANFDAMTRVKGLSGLVPVLRAQIHAALGQFDAALQLFEAHLETAVREGKERLHADLVADQAWCRMNLGQWERAYREAVAAEALIDSAGHSGDRAMAHGRLAQVFVAAGDVNRAGHHKRLALDAFAKHDALKLEILRVLGDSREICPVE